MTEPVGTEPKEVLETVTEPDKGKTANDIKPINQNDVKKDLTDEAKDKDRKDRTPKDYLFLSGKYVKYNTKANRSVIQPGIPELTTALLTNMNEYYKYIKKFTSGFSAIGEREGNYALHLNKVVAYLGKASSEKVLDYYKNELSTYITTPSTMRNIKTINHITMPNLLLDAPPPDYSIYTVNQGTGSIYVSNKKDLYLPNFKVVQDGPRGKRMKYTSIVSNTYTEKDLEEGKIAGLNAMFENSVKPRCHSPLQAFLVAALAYRCTSCQKNYDEDCVCYRKSPSLWAIMQFVSPGKGAPFYYKSSHSTIVLSRNYESISSMVPLLWYLLCEVSVRTSTGLFDENLEAIIVDHYLNSATTNFTGNMMTRRDDYDKELDKLLHAPMYSYDIDRLCARVMKIEQLDGKAPKLDFPFWQQATVSDYDTRRLFSALYYLGHPPMYVHGSMALALERSAAATIPKNYTTFVQTEAEMSYGTATSPYSVNFLNSANDIFQEIVEMLQEHPPDIEQLRYEFFSSATSNSAGVPPEVMAERRKALESDPTIPDELKKAIAGISSKRIGDVLYAMKDFSDPETYLHGGAYTAVAGTRKQVDRRPRVIQMVATHHMLAGYVIYRMLKRAIELSEHSSSGKNSGDMRDMMKVLACTGRRAPCSSNDVAGMDTSTYHDHETLVTMACVEYIRKIDPSLRTTPVFVNEQKSQNGVGIESVPIQVTVNNTLPIAISPIEFVLLMHLGPKYIPAFVRDDMFQDYAPTSLLTFPSGQFNTSTQHTAIGVALMRRMHKTLPPSISNYNIQVLDDVLGDDQFLGVISRLDNPPVTCNTLADTLQQALGELGYDTDPAVKPGCAEFLKLQGVNGAISQYSNRLPIFSSERGDGVDVPPTRRITETDAVIVEYSARVPNTLTTVTLRLIHAYVSSYVKITLAKGVDGSDIIHSAPNVTNHPIDPQKHITGTLSRLGIPITKRPKLDKNQSKNFSYEELATGPKLVYWEDETERDHALLLLHGIWYCIPQIGLPIPAHINNRGQFIQMCSPYYFPSPLTCKLLADMITKPYGYQDQAYRKQPLHEAAYSLSMKLASRLRGAKKLNRLQKMMLFHESPHFLNPVDVIDPDLDRFVGVSYAYNTYINFKQTPARIEPNQAIDSIKEAANSLLQPQKRYASYEASMQLKKYGIVVPDSVAYHNRQASRIDSIMRDQKASVDLRLNQLGAMHESERIARGTADAVILGQFDWTLSKERKEAFAVPQGFSNFGYGSSVPPHSLQAFLMEHLGLPDPRTPSKGHSSEMIRRYFGIDVASTVYTVLLEAHTKGRAAVELAQTALQLPKQVAEMTEKVTFGMLGVRAEIPYAINPRTFFTISTNQNTLPLHYVGNIDSTPFKRLLLVAIACAFPNTLNYGIEKFQIGNELAYVSS